MDAVCYSIRNKTPRVRCAVLRKRKIYSREVINLRLCKHFVAAGVSACSLWFLEVLGYRLLVFLDVDLYHRRPSLTNSSTTELVSTCTCCFRTFFHEVLTIRQSNTLTIKQKPSEIRHLNNNNNNY